MVCRPVPPLSEKGPRLKPSIGLTFATLLMSVSVVACGEDAPAVCSSVDDLRSSIDDLREIDVTSSGGIDALEGGLETVETNISSVKSDAQAEFDTQIEAVDTSLAGLKSSVDDAKADPTAATLAAAASALSDFGTDVGTLIDDVQSTC